MIPSSALPKDDASVVRGNILGLFQGNCNIWTIRVKDTTWKAIVMSAIRYHIDSVQCDKLILSEVRKYSAKNVIEHSADALFNGAPSAFEQGTAAHNVNPLPINRKDRK